MAPVVHPRIRPGALEDRQYQADIARAALGRNTLAVLPTGLGKTAIALRLMAEMLDRHPDRGVLFLAPTRPLVVQHARSVEEAIVGPAPRVLTGTVAPGRRAEEEEAGEAEIVVATPQVIANDLARGAFRLDRLSLIVVDEAHRAVGDYPYVAIGRANAVGPRARVLAMTASPGSQKARIAAVWYNLGLEHFEYRTERSPDVAPYLHGVGVTTVEVPFPAEIQHVATLLRTVVARAVQRIPSELLPPGEVGRRSLLLAGERLHGALAAYRARGEPVPPGLWASVTAQSVAMKGLHALELAESQGVDALRAFLSRQELARGKALTPAQRAFLGDPDVVRVRELLADGRLSEHPKLATAARIVREELTQRPASRVLVFSQYRDTVDRLVEELRRDGDGRVRPARFVGQAAHGGEAGLSQREQVRLLDEFRRGEVNCLVATSVAEEGLDIPSTDLVVLYEPIPDVVRTIQRRGRTGRARTGRAVVLVARGTRDEAMLRASSARERRMHAMLEEVEEEARAGRLRPPSPTTAQRLLEEFEDA
ncbi:MAG: helicase-related protein [Thermoplasmata archaeon]